MVVTGKPSATLLSAYTAVGTANAQYFLFCSDYYSIEVRLL